MNANPESPRRAIVVGGGPAGLMAAEVLSAGGVQVDLYDAMPSVGRKFLLAGKGGMNITHSEDVEAFAGRYGKRRAEVGQWLDGFTPRQVREWIHGLGIDTFVGSSGRVFPTDMKAAPLLRAWLHRLREAGVRFHMRHRWLGWRDGALVFATPDGDMQVDPNGAATVLALGGASWARLGSDGAWVPLLAERGVAVAPLVPANCGFDADWSAHFAERHAGAPLSTVALALDGGPFRKGQFVVTATGIEGSLVYALSASIRDRIARDGQATVLLDLLPDHDARRVFEEVTRPRGTRSMASHLQSRLGIKGVKSGLLHECLSKADYADPAALARALKALPLVLKRARPIDEAISSAGGVRFDALGGGAMLRDVPGVFVAGEMVDWEAPTGGYLLTACFGSGRAAGRAALDWLGAPAPVFRRAVAADTARCFHIETTAYEGDEAATREKIATRIAQYPDGFLVMELDGEIAGFINSGCAHDVVMSDEAFKELVGHDPAATNVVIMSVVLDPAHQGKGHATRLMREFVERMRALGKTTIHLMCKDRHVALYEHFGYRYVKPSASDHGGMAWHEMVMEL